jgi:hypothetical protein
MIRATIGILASQGGIIPLLLDTYTGAAAAYSLRLLRSAYTGDAIRVRRASDNTEQDIGFVDNELDTSALTTFCSGANGFVKTWYDQSGNANDATQATAANQPQIVSSGSVLLLNSKPSIQSANTLKVLQAVNISYNECYISVVFNRTGKSGGTDTLYAFNNPPYNQLYSGSSNWSYFTNAANNTTIPLSTSQKLITQIDNGTNTLFYDDNNLDSTFGVSANVSSDTLNLLAYQTTYGTFGNIQEFILYSADKTSDRTGINANINDFYSIY